MKYTALLLLCSCSFLISQVTITSIQKLPIPQDERWSYPVFSHNGKEIFFTNADFNGIWHYSLSTNLLKNVTSDKHSGYNFSLSDDGSKIAYRRTVVEGDHVTRVQEIVSLDLKTLERSIGDRGNSISTPVFVNDMPSSIEKLSGQQQTISGGIVSTQVLGIENTKIALLKNGYKVLFDPLNQGQYIWPQLSPDRSKIVAVEMDRGAFISDISGQTIERIGKCNAPQWIRSGQWIIGMDDKDDGHRIVSSDIIAVSLDGKVRLNLTPSFEGVSMFPACSPTENKIIFSTSDGEIFLLVYEEAE